jgi:hypothetical protein
MSSASTYHCRVRFLPTICFSLLGLVPSPAFAAAEDAGTADSGRINAEADARSSNGAERVSPAAIDPSRRPTVALKVVPQDAAIGEPIEWRLEIRRRKDDRVHLSSGASFGGLEVRERDVRPGAEDGDWINETLVVELIGFEAGERQIPAQKLTVIDSTGRVGNIEAPERTVTVKSLLANEPEPELKPDLGPGEVVVERDDTLLWILGGIAAAGLVALLTLLGRWLWSKRRPRPESPPPPPRPAEEIALEKLEALSRSPLLDEGRVKEFHVILSETIREYLGNRYEFDSLELSSEELVTALRRSKISPEDLSHTLDFLAETDLVKFAKVILTLEESRALLERSMGFVHRTTPRPAAANREGADA